MHTTRHRYARWDGSSDYHFAKYMLSDHAKWLRTNDPSKAALFVVPMLSGLQLHRKIGDTLGYRKMFTGSPSVWNVRDAKDQCGRVSYKHWVAQTVAAIKASPNYGKPHVVVSGGYVLDAAIPELLELKNVFVAYMEPNLTVDSTSMMPQCNGRRLSRQAARALKAAQKSGRLLLAPYFSQCSSLERIVRGASLGFVDRNTRLHFRGRYAKKPARPLVCGYAQRDKEMVAAGMLATTGAEAEGGPVVVAANDAGVVCSGDKAPERETGGYCEEVSHTAFSLNLLGDTPTSSRFFDAANLAVPLAVESSSPGCLDVLGGSIPWETFVHQVQLPFHELAGKNIPPGRFGSALGTTPQRWQVLKDETARWAPMLSWHAFPETTSMYILAQAATNARRGAPTTLSVPPAATVHMHMPISAAAHLRHRQPRLQQGAATSLIGALVAATAVMAAAYMWHVEASQTAQTWLLSALGIVGVGAVVWL